MHYKQALLVIASKNVYAFLKKEFKIDMETKENTFVLQTPLEKREKLDVKKAFCGTLLELAEKDERLVVLDADLMRCSGTVAFAKKFPDRHFQVGVAEQNLIGVAAGLALSGFIPYACTFANFATKRAADQCSISVGYNEANVKICGTYAGVSTGKNGGTHASVEDIAFMRAIPRMVVVAPADTVELEKAVRALYDYEGPCYLRTVRDPMPQIFTRDYEFKIGRGVVLKNGNDVTLMGTESTTYTCLLAAQVLEKEGIHARVVHLSTIKPIDVELIVKAAEETKGIVTVENHNVYGGFGGAVAEVLTEHCPVFLKRLGIQDEFGETATFAWQIEHFGFGKTHIAAAAKEIIEKKKP